MDEGGWTCSILFNGLVSDTFLNNLNVVLPRLNGVEGEWVRMHRELCYVPCVFRRSRDLR